MRPFLFPATRSARTSTRNPSSCQSLTFVLLLIRNGITPCQDVSPRPWIWYSKNRGRKKNFSLAESSEIEKASPSWRGFSFASSRLGTGNWGLATVTGDSQLWTGDGDWQL